MREAAGHRGLRLGAAVAVVASAVAVVSAGAQAHPPAPFGPGGQPITGTIHHWLHQAKVPLVHGRIRILIGGCPGTANFVGCIFTRRPRVIYLSPAARQPRAVLYHELGHTFDMRVLRPRHRRAFKRIVGIHTRGWFTSRPPAAEYFADAYALCAERGRLRQAQAATAYGYRATPRMHRRICALIREAAAPARPKHRRKRPPAPSPPQDAPPVAEPTQPPPPRQPGSEEEPSGPYQPPGPTPPAFPGCGPIDALLTGCDPG